MKVLFSYRVIELGGGAGLIGVTLAAYSFLPLCLAVYIGRRVDRGFVVSTVVWGTVLSSVPVAIAAGVNSLVWVIIASMFLGLGQLATTVASQALIARYFPTVSLNSAFGWLTLMVSIGQAVGIPIAGFIAAAGSSHPSPGVAMWVLAGVSALLFPLLRTMVSVRGSGHVSRSAAKKTAVGSLTILRQPGMKPAIIASMATLAAVDILHAYMPYMGHRYGLSVELVTVLLTTRTLASIASRVLIGCLTARYKTTVLLYTASFVGGVCMAAMTVFSDFGVLLVAMVIAGCAFGLTQPLTMTWVTTLADRHNRAAVLGVRLAGNRLSQVIVPVVSGFGAAVVTDTLVFGITAGFLFASSAITYYSIRKASPEELA